MMVPEDGLPGAVVVAEDSFEGWPVGPDEEELEKNADDAGSDSCASGQGQVEQQDVDQDGPQDDESDGDVAADDQQDSGDDVEDSVEGYPSMREHEVGQNAGIAGYRRIGHEVQEVVEPKDEEDESKQNAGDQDGYFHQRRTPWNGLVENSLCVLQLRQAV
jgi:hypothetical protein